MIATRFTIAVPDEKLAKIRARLELAEIGPAPADDADWRYGTDARYLAEFRDYWLSSYDWRRAEAELNALPQFKAAVDGIEIHFYHVTGDGSDPFPLILTHGWPGSVVEFLAAMPLLAARGYSVVVPSLPGYGFSGRPPVPVGPRRTAALWRMLMVDVLGYRRFGAQGGDWGSMVTRALGRDHGDVVAAIHLNMLHHVPGGTPSPAVADYLARVGELMRREGSYAAEHATKPQTIGLALADTPIGFAAWVIEKNRSWTDCHGDLESVLSKDQLITNIMTYLVNDAVGTAIWMYRGVAGEDNVWPRIAVPTGFAEFPAEFLPPPPRAAVEQDFNLVHWRRMAKGGHFAAWEQPAAFAEEVAGFFDRWR
ncbi:epoxide hydrolase family protein [uncultured Sphingomonas sp.]|uniref:epoxide hydrolase family protein n=1 Tax=uncultured Sphingomonas sp. TaxID=158754 RepID=UPI0035C966A1